MFLKALCLLPPLSKGATIDPYLPESPMCFSQSKLVICALSFMTTISLHLKYAATFRFLIHFLVEFSHISFWFQVGQKINTHSQYSFCSKNLNIDFTRSSESIYCRVAWEKRGRKRRASCSSWDLRCKVTYRKSGRKLIIYSYFYFYFYHVPFTWLFLTWLGC